VADRLAEDDITSVCQIFIVVLQVFLTGERIVFVSRFLVFGLPCKPAQPPQQ